METQPNWNVDTAKQVLSACLDSLNEPDKPLNIPGFELLPVYKTPGGKLALCCQLSTFLFDPDKTFNFEKDKRGQVGHMLSHLEKLSRENPQNAGYTGYNYHYSKFLANAHSVVLIIAKDDDWDWSLPLKEELMQIDSLLCRKLVDFSRFGKDFADVALCSNFCYANDQIPNTDIFGSGCFIAPGKIATAAHVFEQAVFRNLDPKNLLFIQGHYAYRKTESIKINPYNIYCLDQDMIINERQIVYGQTGDTVWAKVKPYFDNTGDGNNPQIGGKRNVPEKVKIKKPKKGDLLYALGHGLGVPMKLSYDCKVQGVEDSFWFDCDMNVFPGNSGSPIFDANTHELVGIVSGMNVLDVSKKKGTNCVMLHNNNEGMLSIRASQITPLLQKL